MLELLACFLFFGVFPKPYGFCSGNLGFAKFLSGFAEKWVLMQGFYRVFAGSGFWETPIKRKHLLGLKVSPFRSAL